MRSLNVVLCWHMHQPDYRHQGVYLRPWTWLHAIKDYSDMVAHLEDAPGARAVVNFSPILLEQLQDYPARISHSLNSADPGNDAIGDLILDALAGRLPPVDQEPVLLRSLLRVNEATMGDRFEPYSRLHERARHALAEGGVLERASLDDLLVWYVLVWMGESLRGHEMVLRLQAKAQGFSEADRLELLGMVAQTIRDLIPRYRALALSGQIELSLTPYAHPIMPLLHDMDSAREAWPDVVLPQGDYPGGNERCAWHLQKARLVFRAAFGMDAKGCWPSEGAISGETVRLLEQEGFHWTASGAQVLRNSLADSEGLPQLKTWQLADGKDGRHTPACFFRDDELSDRIGFEYSKWNATDAVADFVSRLEQRLKQSYQESSGPDLPVLSIIMDGENAWEYFPCNGSEFLSGLYAALSSHPHIRLTTFSDAQKLLTSQTLEKLNAGSWVYGNFSTWVGDAAKNRAWEVLIAAKRAVDSALGPELEQLAESGQPHPDWVQRIIHQLAVCEASDWFWWLGDDNQLEDGPAFDLLFRQQVSALYELIGLVPPDTLGESLNQPGQHAAAHPQPSAAGAMKPTVLDSVL